MDKKSIWFIISVLIVLSPVSATTVLYVPDDFSSIQSAITASEDYDIIVVRPGTYIENINFLGKKIIVKSEMGPDVTIIDGNQSGSVVSFTAGEDDWSIIEGFTITNGTGTMFGNAVCGGGVYCQDSSPTIKSNIIRNNDISFHAIGYGGGIYMHSSLTSLGRITNNLIIENEATDGGGVYATSAYGINLFNSTICENEASNSGGGLWAGPLAWLCECIIWDNHCTTGAEIFGTPIVFYSDIKGGYYGPGGGNINADPLFYDPINNDYRLKQDPSQPGVVNPCVDTGYIFDPIINGSTRTDGFQDTNIIDIGFHYNTTPLGNLYIPDDYPTIQEAIDVCGNGDTIIVRPGTYFENIIINEKNVNIISEKGPDFTIIDGSRRDTVVTYLSSIGVPTVLEGFTITNGLFMDGGGIRCDRSTPVIRNNRIVSNEATEIGGGGILCESSAPTIIGNIISNNHATWGGGINCDVSSALIANNIIWGNTSSGGGGISCSECSPSIVSNTLVGNSGHYGKEIQSMYNSNPLIANTIIWNSYSPNDPLILVRYRNNTSSALTISHCNVAGGMAAIQVDSGCTLNWGAGMIDASPCFEDMAGSDFHLRWDSPCRNAGDSASVPTVLLGDFEGDPRIVGTVDMGVDEFYYHLYHTGDVLPGSPIDIKVIGIPGLPTLLALGTSIQDPPRTTPYGDLWLTMPLAKSWQLGPIPSTGILTMSATVPSGWPSGSIHPFQALVGPWGGGATRLTNLLKVEVQ